MEHAHIAALRGLALLGVRPLPLDNGSATNQANERGEHEASIRSDVQTGLPDRRGVLRADHDSDSGRSVPVDPLQRGAGNVVRVSAACSGAGVQKPHADTVRAAELCAVHASGRGRFFNWISASSIESNRSIRSSWVGAGVCSLSHACGSVRASAMDALLCFGLGGSALPSLRLVQCSKRDPKLVADGSSVPSEVTDTGLGAAAFLSDLDLGEPPTGEV